MKINDIITEAPLSDFQKLDSDRYVRVRAFTPQVIQKFERYLNDIGYDIAAYVMFSPSSASKKAPHLSKLMHNSEDLSSGFEDVGYYKKITKNNLEKLIGDKVEYIQSDSNTITIVYVVTGSKAQRNDVFPITSWGLIHDLIHGMDMGEKNMHPSMEQADKLILDLELFLKASIFKSMTVDLAYIMTTKSAREGSLRKAQEESTELFTQWIVKGDILFKLPKSMSDKLSDDQKKDFENKVHKVKQEMINCFQKVLDDAVGNIYLVQI